MNINQLYQCFVIRKVYLPWAIILTLNTTTSINKSLEKEIKKNQSDARLLALIAKIIITL